MCSCLTSRCAANKDSSLPRPSREMSLECFQKRARDQSVAGCEKIISHMWIKSSHLCRQLFFTRVLFWIIRVVLSPDSATRRALLPFGPVLSAQFSHRLSSRRCCVPGDRHLENPSDTHLSAKDTRGSMGRPIIQISLKDFETRKNEIASELWRAATEIGFFYLKDHGLTDVGSCLIALVPQLLCHATIDLCLMHSDLFTHKRILQAEMQHMLSLSEQFFNLPAEQKANFKFDLVSYQGSLCKSLCTSHQMCLRPCVLRKIYTIYYILLCSEPQTQVQKKNIGWESGQQKRASAKVPELKESLQLKWHDMEGRWPTNDDVPDFESYSKVSHLLMYPDLAF